MVLGQALGAEVGRLVDRDHDPIDVSDGALVIMNVPGPNSLMATNRSLFRYSSGPLPRCSFRSLPSPELEEIERFPETVHI